MIRNPRNAAACAVLLAMMAVSRAAEAPADSVPLPLARAVVDKTIELVESRGLYPVKQSDYALFKTALLADVDGHTATVDRALLYRDINGLLAMLDADRHAFLVPPAASGQAKAAPPAQPTAPAEPATFSLVATAHGMVLHWVPPGVPAFTSGASQTDYVKRVYAEAAARPEFAGACALVVDLSAQTGGNAWPPFIAMYPLFSDTNSARWVDRDGKRLPFVNRMQLESMARERTGAGGANPLARFAAGPLAVVVGEGTASAGEMLLVALLGEARVQTFGRTSYGLTTANMTYPMPDGSTLILSEMRYALGDGPVYRGGIPAMHPQPKGEPPAASVQAAAAWAAAQSPQCAAGVSPALPSPPARMP